MSDKKFNLSENKVFIEILSSIAAIIFGLLFGYILMLLVNPEEATEGFGIILKGPFSSKENLSKVMRFSVPLILTGLSVGFAFKTGLFNIGASGQLTIGAFIAVFIGVKFPELGSWHWFVAVLGAIIGGALWGAIPGILKAYRNVNEVVSSIMLNYIAMYLVSFLIKKKIYLAVAARALPPKESARIPMFGIDKLFIWLSDVKFLGINKLFTEWVDIRHFERAIGGFVIAIIVVVILHIVLNHTVFGYELKSVGFNRKASKYAGMNAKRNIVFSMMISGAIAGLAGATMFLQKGVNMKIETVILTEGFDGIAISLLGLSTPIGVFLAAIFYGALKQGGFLVQVLNFKPEIIDIIIASIIYFSALSLFLRKYIIKLVKLTTKGTKVGYEKSKVTSKKLYKKYYTDRKSKKGGKS